jgi:hypothetical protein
MNADETRIRKPDYWVPVNLAHVLIRANPRFIRNWQLTTDYYYEQD